MVLRCLKRNVADCEWGRDSSFVAVATSSATVSVNANMLAAIWASPIPGLTNPSPACSPNLSVSLCPCLLVCVGVGVSVSVCLCLCLCLCVYVYPCVCGSEGCAGVKNKRRAWLDARPNGRYSLTAFGSPEMSLLKT